MATRETIPLFGIEIDKIDMSAAIQTIAEWMDDHDPSCRVVVTPNVDHVVMLQSNPLLRAAYADASLVLADGFPLVVASRLVGNPLPERVAGSELVPRLFDSAHDRPQRTRVFLLGAMPGVAVRAARRIDSDWPDINVVGTYSPPLGFEKDEKECEAILQRISGVSPDLIILGVGSPKQELWAHRHRDRVRARALLCVGATIDFLAGEKKQAPKWMRRSGLEWFYRWASEPERLTGRYARGALLFPQILYREWDKTRSRPSV